jgi:hypothetical protein
LASFINDILTRLTVTGAAAAAAATETVTKAQTRLGQTSAASGRQFSAQAQGLGGLVGAYAGAAANIFAITAAFTALASAARSEQTLQGINTLAAGVGESGPKILASLQAITKGQLTLTEAASNANLALSSGFDTDQIERLTAVSLKASRALGRDLNDAFSRLVRGSAKLEPELLDELGIFARIDPAVQAYAISTGKLASALSRFEKQQAFVNAVITEGERKFAAINVTIPTSAERIERLGATVLNVITIFGQFLANSVAPLADFLSSNLTGSLAAVALLLRIVLAKAVTEVAGKFAGLNAGITKAGATAANFATSLSATTTANRAAAASSLSLINVTNAGVRADQEKLKAIRASALAGTLSNAQIRESIPLLARQAAAVRTATLAITADTNAKYVNQLASTAAKNASASAAAAAATTGAFAGLGRAAEVTAVGVSTFTGAITSSVAGVVSLAGRLVGIISIFTILATMIAGVTGTTKEFGVLMGDLAKKFKGLIGYDAKFSKFKDTLGVFAAQSLTNIEKTNDGLRNLNDFTIDSKIIGIDINITKTKQELVSEVASAVAAATAESRVSITSGLAGLFSFQAVRVVAARLITGVVTATLAGLGSLATPIGTAVGLAVAAGVGLAVERAFRDDTIIDPSVVAKLKEQFSGMFDGLDATQIQTLAKTITALKDDSQGLSLQSKLYLKTQVQIAAELINQTRSYKALVSLQEITGIAAEKLQTVLGRVDDTVNSIYNTFAGGEGIQFINAEEVSKQLDIVADKLNETRDNATVSRLRSGSMASASLQSQGFDDNGMAAALDSINAFADKAEQANTELFTLYSILESIGGSLATSLTSFADFKDLIVSGAQDLDQINTGLIAIQNSAEAASAAQQAALLRQKIITQTILDAEQKRVSLSNQLGGVLGQTGLADGIRDQIALQDAVLDSLREQAEQTNSLLQNSAEDVANAIAKVKTAEALSLVQSEILKINLKMRDTFNAEIASASKLNGLFNESFQIATDESAIRSNNLRIVNEQYAAGIALVEQQKDNNADLQTAGFSQRNIQKILGLTKDMTEEQLDAQLRIIGATDEQSRLVKELNMLTGAQQVQLQASATAQQILTGAIAKTVAEAKKLTDELAKLSRLRGEKSALAVLKQTLDLNKLDADIAKSKAQAAAASLSAETQLLQLQQKAYDLALKRSDLQAKQKYDSATAIGGAAFGGLITDKQKAGFEIKFEEESLARLEDSLSKQQKFITDIAANEIAKLNAQAGAATADKNARDQAIKDQRAIQNKQEEFAKNEEIRQLNLLKLKGALIDEEGKMLIGIVGALAAATLGPNATPDQKSNAASLAEADLKSKLKNNNLNFVEQVDKQITDIDNLYKSQTARNKALDARAEEASEAAATAAKAGIATQIQAIQLQAELDSQALQDQIAAKKAGIQLLQDMAAVEGNSMLKGLAKGFSNAIDSISSKLNQFFDAIAYGDLTLENFKEGFNDLVFTIVDDIRRAFVQETIIDPITDWLKGTASSLLSSVFGVSIGPKEATILGDGSMLVTVTNGMQNADPTANVEDKDNFFTKVFENIKTGFNSIFGQGGTISGLVSSVFGQEGLLSTAIRGIGETGRNVFSSLGNFITDILGSLTGSSSSGGGDFLSSIIGMFSGGTPAPAMAAGGIVRHMADGGGVNGLRDRVPAMLEPGEFVLSKKAAGAIGTPGLQSMNAGGGAGGNVVVNIKNEGTPQQADASKPKFDGEKYVIDIVTRDLQNNGPIRRTMRAGG